MRKLLLLLWILACLFVSAQDGKNPQRKQRPALISNDSVLNKIVKQQDSILEDIKVREAKEKIARDFDKLIEDQKRRGEKRANILRIGLGIAILILIVMAIVLSRRKK